MVYRPSARELIQRIDKVLEEQDDPFNTLDLTDLINQAEIAKGNTVQVAQTEAAPQADRAMAAPDFQTQRTEAFKVFHCAHIINLMYLYILCVHMYLLP